MVITLEIAMLIEHSYRTMRCAIYLIYYCLLEIEYEKKAVIAALL